jgi:hypothetical protein
VLATAVEQDDVSDKPAPPYVMNRLGTLTYLAAELDPISVSESVLGRYDGRVLLVTT